MARSNPSTARASLRAISRKSGVALGLGGGPHPPHHLRRIDHGLVVQMAAALGVDLVLDMAAGQPLLLDHADRAGGVHRLAEAGVEIDDRRQLGDPGDLMRPPSHLRQGCQADIRHAEIGGQDRAGDVDSVESLGLDLHGDQRRIGAGGLQQFPGVESGPQNGTFFRRRLLCEQHQKIPSRLFWVSRSPATETVRSSSAPAERFGNRSTAARNLSCSSSSTMLRDRILNLFT